MRPSCTARPTSAYNLNFGNPENPETMGYIVKAIEGMAQACKELDFPVVSGNVSLYNETDGVAIPPTPVCGGVGLIEDVSKIATLKGAQAGDVLILIGETKGHLGASLYAREILGLEGDALGPPPPVDLETEKRNANFVRSLIEQGLVNAVHDVSEGGIACAAAEMALASGVGVLIDYGDIDRDIFKLLGERSGTYLVATSEVSEDKIYELAKKANIPALSPDAEFGGTEIVIDRHGQGAGPFKLPLSRLREAHEGWLPNYMSKVD